MRISQRPRRCSWGASRHPTVQRAAKTIPMFAGFCLPIFHVNIYRESDSAPSSKSSLSIEG